MQFLAFLPPCEEMRRHSQAFAEVPGMWCNDARVRTKTLESQVTREL